MAMGAVGRVRETGGTVPGDMSVVGFDDHDLAQSFGLTTIRQPVPQMGRTATQRLLDSIGDPERTPTHDSVEVSLVQRGSTAAP